MWDLGIRRLLHPVYSPDLNPAEIIFNRTKQRIQCCDRESLKDLEAAIRKSFDVLQPYDIEELYRHQRDTCREVINRNGWQSGK